MLAYFTFKGHCSLLLPTLWYHLYSISKNCKDKYICNSIRRSTLLPQEGYLLICNKIFVETDNEFSAASAMNSGDTALYNKE